MGFSCYYFFPSRNLCMANPLLILRSALCVLCGLLPATPAFAERATVLQQIALPHNYYYREMYLPQLTNGPSSVAWSPDGSMLVYSMQGSLWLQALDSSNARQVTAGPGYDYQPDWSPDGRTIVFTRYLQDEMELQLLDIDSGKVRRLTATGAVNVEPRWSPDGAKIAWVSTAGTGRFHIVVGAFVPGFLAGEGLQPTRKSATPRVYYSEFDHELSPAWSPDGTELVFVSNPENAYGTGGLWRRGLDASATPVLVGDEETTWKARPDWSPDGKRIIWSSYQGRQWHQLWLTTAAGGGDPLPLTYGEFDITAARWSPDGRNIAYLSNESGDTRLWVMELPGGRTYRIEQQDRQYLRPMGSLALSVVDETGRTVAARVSVTGSDGRSYGPISIRGAIPGAIPGEAWMHADDAFDRKVQEFETHYFQLAGTATIQLPAGPAEVTVWRGLEHAIARRTVEISADRDNSLTLQSLPLAIPQDWKNQWHSGDVHVHMNYAGAYRNAPAHLMAQASAEDLDVVFNLIVNKEQRIPDIAYFSTAPDDASTAGVLLLHGQEFHTGYWGHLGLLGLDDHFLLPDYSAYINTGLASPYPDNSTVADLAHQQGALVGYVHPFDAVPDPDHDASLTNGLPIDVALGKVDYYEVSGFSDYRATQQVWYRLLNCGFRVTAAGGTDAMANFASLRGPVGLNRTYVQTAAGPDDPASRRDRWLSGLKAGHTMATNGPILSFTLAGQPPGGDLSLPAGEHTLDFSGFMQSLVAIDHLEVVHNGKVVQTLAKNLKVNTARNAAQFSGQLKLSASGWVVLRAWNEDSSPDLFDRFPFATTNPVFVEVDGQALRSAGDADYFLRWIARVREHTVASTAYNTAAEREAVLSSIDVAATVFEKRK
jgi:Tol biopolymer transport system component